LHRKSTPAKAKPHFKDIFLWGKEKDYNFGLRQSSKEEVNIMSEHNLTTT